MIWTFSKTFPNSRRSKCPPCHTLRTSKWLKKTLDWLELTTCIILFCWFWFCDVICRGEGGWAMEAMVFLYLSFLYGLSIFVLIPWSSLICLYAMIFLYVSLFRGLPLFAFMPRSFFICLYSIVFLYLSLLHDFWGPLSFTWFHLGLESPRIIMWLLSDKFDWNQQKEGPYAMFAYNYTWKWISVKYMSTLIGLGACECVLSIFQTPILPHVNACVCVFRV